MTIDVKTISELLVKARGNHSELARRLNVSRHTISKYIKDVKAERHAVINGRLMVQTGSKSGRRDG